MTVLQLHGPMAFRVLQWCHPMPASIKEDKLLFPDDHLIWCPKVDSGPRIDLSTVYPTSHLCVVLHFQIFKNICLELKDVFQWLTKKFGREQDILNLISEKLSQECPFIDLFMLENLYLLFVPVRI